MQLIQTLNKKIKLGLLIIIIIIASLPIRLWHLTDYPRMIVDESANLRDINKILSNKTTGITDFEWGFGQAIAVQYPSALLVRIYGQNREFFALRLTSVLFSLLALIPFFFIVRYYSNDIIAFCTTLLFSFSYYYLQFSRVGWTNILVVTMSLYLMWLVISISNKYSLPKAVLAGFLSGLIFYGYRGGHIYIAASFIFLSINLLNSMKFFKKNLVILLLFISSFAITSFPWYTKIINNYEQYNLRSKFVLIFNNPEIYHTSIKTDIIGHQIITTFKSWILLEPVPTNAMDIEGPRYLPLQYPPINLLIKIAFWGGLIIATLKFKQNYIWLFILITGLIFGQILTVYPPNGSRGLILLPIIYLFSSFSFYKLYLLTNKNAYTLSAILVLSLIFATHDFLFYQYWMTWIRI
ncbi:MAG: glycosyltransferase family 39 protein [Candidatus Daviesbacteria bacterium]|nr:glycosyltransferase family 39 protein [Candidatus Daviesbacteria bacterium]